MHHAAKTLRKMIGAAMFVALFGGVGASAPAAEISGAVFLEKNKAAQGELVLNAAEAVPADCGPKRIALRMLREAAAKTVNSAFHSGCRNNFDDAAWLTLQARMELFEQKINCLVAVKKGDALAIDILGDGATQIAINGVAIPGRYFSTAVLAIFIGAHPADEQMKTGLLGSGA